MAEGAVAAPTAAGRHGGAAPILMYHGLADERTSRPAGERRFWVARNRFARQLALARAGGFTSRSLAEVHAGIPDRGVAISFDDGNVSDYEIAWEALLKAGMRAEFFVNPVNVGHPGYLNWPQARELAQGGMGIESHGWAHENLTRLPARVLRDRLERSKHEIESHTGREVKFLSAPFGVVNRQVIVTARAVGYRAVCSSAPRLARPGRDELPRFAIYAETSVGEFRQILEGALLARLRRGLRHLATAPARCVWRLAHDTAAEGEQA